jgi:hypothetical protein
VLQEHFPPGQSVFGPGQAFPGIVQVFQHQKTLRGFQAVEVVIAVNILFPGLNVRQGGKPVQCIVGDGQTGLNVKIV